MFRTAAAALKVEKLAVPVKVGLAERATEPDPVDVAEMAIVPELVIGLPATDMKAGTVTATEVTVPRLALLLHTGSPPERVKDCPSEPFANRLKTLVAEP